MATSSPLTHDEMREADPRALLKEQGISAVVLSREGDLDALASAPPPDLALVEVSSMPGGELRGCVHRCAESSIPVLAVVPEGRISEIDMALGVSDFIMMPLNPVELVARARHILWSGALLEGRDVIRTGHLTINPTSYEVSLSGKRVDLRFKEYELLRLLASNPGRVYSREALLSQIWGYDFFGGTRTVDVHIRRLRSKIEDADHSFIETIWNVGYRFRDLG